MENLKISKELLSEVLELKRIDEIYTEDNILYFCELNKGINIYELAHKYKEWAMNKGYQIISGLAGVPAHRREQYEKAYAKINHYYGDGMDNLMYTYTFIRANTEVECILKACEWVLKEQNNV